jgi:4-alpha-glucanotransferase
MTRRSGVLLHPTSLPGRGIGNIGEAGRRWVDWLAGAGQAYWQLLPLVPVDDGGSPYNSFSAFAGNPLLVDLEALVAEGLHGEDELDAPEFPAERVDFPAVIRWKEERLRHAYAAFSAGRAEALREPFEAFCEAQSEWLDEYTLFRALRERAGGRPWTEWEPALRRRDPEALRRARAADPDEVERHAFEQFLFERQWQALREHAHESGVHIIGDVPIFVALDSADVWAHPELFKLDEQGCPEVVSGVPPDYFSADGQLWGNPLYRWDELEAEGFTWWIERFRRTLELVDVVRVDHFRGFAAAWEVPAGAKTARIGEWVEGPGEKLFRAVERELGELPLIAEDLGLITPDVEALRDELELPGMRVLHFAFDGEPENPHLPAQYPARAVVYTGTHDNDTTAGWWTAADAAERERFAHTVGLPERGDPSPEQVAWAAIRSVFGSAAALAVVPQQDVLALGSEARMNTPGSSEGNWAWRFTWPELLDSDAQARLREATRDAQRLHPFTIDESQPVAERPLS